MADVIKEDVTEEIPDCQQELSDLQEEFNKLQEHLTNVEIRYQTEISESNHQKNNDFALRLQDVVCNLFGRSQYSDLKILLDNGNDLSVHKLVLLARSEDWGVPDLDETDVLDLRDVKYEVAYAMLKWVYTDTLELEETEDDLLELLKIATKYKLEALHIKCQNSLIEISNIENYNKFYITASETSAELLKDHCMENLSKQEKSKLETGDMFTDNLPIGFGPKLFRQTRGIKRSKLKFNPRQFSLLKKIDKSEVPEILPKVCISCGENIPKSSQKTYGSDSMLCSDCKLENTNSTEKQTEPIETESSPSKSPNSLQCICKVCGKILSKKSIRGHLKIHSGVKNYTCGICGRSFIRSFHLKRHQMQVHSMVTSNVEESPSDKTNKSRFKKFGCDQCNMAFRDRYHLVRHQKSHESFKKSPKKIKPEASELSEDEDWELYETCEVCGQPHSSVYKYTPIDGSKDINMCIGCRKKRKQLFHPREKVKRICHICGVLIGCTDSLKRHLRSHAGDKSHECQFCGMKFGRQYHLSRHERVHTGEKPYQCSICGKFYRQSNTLQDHMRTHTGIYPYSCQFCGKCFNRKNEMVNHGEKCSGMSQMIPFPPPLLPLHFPRPDPY